VCKMSKENFLPT